MERRSERIFGQRYGSRPVKIADLNSHLMCVLCGGYYIDATTIIECLHSFCRACIVRYLDTSSRCPVCNITIHKAQPLLNIRLDHVLQGLVYKLVPGLLTKELNDRREFYSHGLVSRSKDHVDESVLKSNSKTLCDKHLQKLNKSPKPSPGDSESLSIALEYCLRSTLVTVSKDAVSDNAELKVSEAQELGQNLNEFMDVRYLLCPAGFTVGCLKKFIRAKFDLPLVYQIEIFYSSECLENHLSMVDIAFIFQWQKKAPLQLFYSITCSPRTKRKLTTNDFISQQNDSSKGKQNRNVTVKPSSKSQLTQTPLVLYSSKSSKHSSSTRSEKESRRKHESHGTLGFKKVKHDDIKVLEKEVTHSVLIDDRSKKDLISVARKSREKVAAKDKKTVMSNAVVTVSEGKASAGELVSAPVSVDCNQQKVMDHREVPSSSVTKETTVMGKKLITVRSEGSIESSFEKDDITIDLTGSDINSPVLGNPAVEVMDNSKVLGNGECSDSACRIVGSVTFVGSGSTQVLGNHETLPWGMNLNQVSLNGNLEKPAMAVPCVSAINAFKTVSCGLQNHLGYGNNCNIIGESVITNDMMKIISSPDVTIVPSFGVQIIYSSDPVPVASQNSICGVIRLPQAPIALDSDVLTRGRNWAHDVTENGIMDDADFQRLCEGKSFDQKKASMSNKSQCDHYFISNMFETAGQRIPMENPLSYTEPMNAVASNPVPCVFVAEAGHRQQNSWSCFDSRVEQEGVVLSLCNPPLVTNAAAQACTLPTGDQHFHPQVAEQCLSLSHASLNTQLNSTMQTCSTEKSRVELRTMCTTLPQAVEGDSVDAWTMKTYSVESNQNKFWSTNPQTQECKAVNAKLVEPFAEILSPMLSQTKMTSSVVPFASDVVEPKSLNTCMVEPLACTAVTDVELKILDAGIKERIMEPEAAYTLEHRTLHPTPAEPNSMNSCSLETETLESQPATELVTVDTWALVSNVADDAVVAELEAEELCVLETDVPESNIMEPDTKEFCAAESEMALTLKTAELCTVELQTDELTTSGPEADNNKDCLEKHCSSDEIFVDITESHHQPLSEPLCPETSSRIQDTDNVTPQESEDMALPLFELKEMTVTDSDRFVLCPHDKTSSMPEDVLSSCSPAGVNSQLDKHVTLHSDISIDQLSEGANEDLPNLSHCIPSGLVVVNETPALESVSSCSHIVVGDRQDSLLGDVQDLHPAIPQRLNISCDHESPVYAPAVNELVSSSRVTEILPLKDTELNEPEPVARQNESEDLIVSFPIVVDNLSVSCVASNGEFLVPPEVERKPAVEDVIPVLSKAETVECPVIPVMNSSTFICSDVVDLPVSPKPENSLSEKAESFFPHSPKEELLPLSTKQEDQKFVVYEKERSNCDETEVKPELDNARVLPAFETLKDVQFSVDSVDVLISCNPNDNLLSARPLETSASTESECVPVSAAIETVECPVSIVDTEMSVADCNLQVPATAHDESMLIMSDATFSKEMTTADEMVVEYRNNDTPFSDSGVNLQVSEMNEGVLLSVEADVSSGTMHLPLLSGEIDASVLAEEKSGLCTTNSDSLSDLTVPMTCNEQVTDVEVPTSSDDVPVTMFGDKIPVSVFAEQNLLLCVSENLPFASLSGEIPVSDSSDKKLDIPCADEISDSVSISFMRQQLPDEFTESVSLLQTSASPTSSMCSATLPDLSSFLTPTVLPLMNHNRDCNEETVVSESIPLDNMTVSDMIGDSTTICGLEVLEDSPVSLEYASDHVIDNNSKQVVNDNRVEMDVIEDLVTGEEFVPDTSVEQETGKLKSSDTDHNFEVKDCTDVQRNNENYEMTYDSLDIESCVEPIQSRVNLTLVSDLSTVHLEQEEPMLQWCKPLQQMKGDHHESVPDMRCLLGVVDITGKSPNDTMSASRVRRRRWRSLDDDCSKLINVEEGCCFQKDKTVQGSCTQLKEWSECHKNKSDRHTSHESEDYSSDKDLIPSCQNQALGVQADLDLEMADIVVNDAHGDICEYEKMQSDCIPFSLKMPTCEDSMETSSSVLGNIPGDVNIDGAP